MWALFYVRFLRSKPDFCVVAESELAFFGAQLCAAHFLFLGEKENEQRKEIDRLSLY